MTHFYPLGKELLQNAHQSTSVDFFLLQSLKTVFKQSDWLDIWSRVWTDYFEFLLFCGRLLGKLMMQDFLTLRESGGSEPRWPHGGSAEARAALRRWALKDGAAPRRGFSRARPHPLMWPRGPAAEFFRPETKLQQPNY